VLISSDRIQAIRLPSQAEVGLAHRHAKIELLSNPGLFTVLLVPFWQEDRSVRFVLDCGPCRGCSTPRWRADATDSSTLPGTAGRKQGYRDLTIDDFCAGAGVSKGTFDSNSYRRGLAPGPGTARTLREWVDEAVEARGLPIDLPPNALAAVLLAMSEGFVFCCALDRHAFRWETISQAIVRVFDGFAAHRHAREAQ
jgi:hypothetical protein